MKNISNMLRFPFLVAISLSGITPSYSQSDKNAFRQYRDQQKANYAQYVQQTEADYRAFRDSLNREYAAFLAKEWDSFELRKPEPPIKNPIAAPPVYNPTRPQPKPLEVPVQVVLPVRPKPVIPDHLPKPDIDLPKQVVNMVFFGTDIWVKELPKSKLYLSGVAEKGVAEYWLSLSQLPHYEWKNDALRIKNELNLNDWGVYQLLNHFFKLYFPQGSGNEQVIFTVFMLNQMDYQAKIGRNGNELMPLIAFQQDVYNSLYFTYGNKTSIKYSALNPTHKNISNIQTCGIDYAIALNKVDLSIQTSPDFAIDAVTKALTPDKGVNTYEIEYNQNRVDFYKDYPCVYYTVHAEAALDEIVLESINEQILPAIKDKTQEEAVNWLLHFIQNAFEYKTDFEQFGYERWFFAEETIASSYSDCEDRAILFAQLVRRLLGMSVVLIHYPNIHLATAVKFNNSQTKGDYVTLDGEDYLICDPTYLNAGIGRSMPDLKNTKVELIRLSHPVD
jgi:hypothetical protein